MFRFFLLDAKGQPFDPVSFTSAVPNWQVGETFSLGSGETLRILEIRADVAPEVSDAGFHGVFLVERV
jgi:hypothetical protein